LDEKESVAFAALIDEFAALRRELADNDRQSAIVAVLTEEFKTRWHQLIELDNDVNRWMSSYSIALVVGISWLLSSERIGDLRELFSQRNYHNSYFILSLALINAAYILALTFKGYQIQQLRFYIDRKICAPLNKLVRITANEWEKWHRTEFTKSPRRKGKPEWRRVLYYPIITILPFGVSVSILWTYYEYASTDLGWLNPHNLYFYFVILINLVAVVLSVSTAGFNKKWKEIINQDIQQKETSDNGQGGEEKEIKAQTLEPQSNYSKSSTNAYQADLQTTATANMESYDMTISPKGNSAIASFLGYAFLVGATIFALKAKSRPVNKE
jgi:hypothetical protein